jgi:hypothetical protein
MSFLRLPTEHVILSTKLSPDEAQQRLAGQIEPPGLVNPIAPSRFLFIGELRDYQFRLSQISGFGKRGSGNTITGTIHPADTGSTIHIQIQPIITEYYLGFAYIIVPIGISLLFISATIRGELPPSCGLFPAIVFGLGFLLLRAIGGSRSEIQTIGQLREVFEAEVVASETPLPNNE